MERLSFADSLFLMRKFSKVLCYRQNGQEWKSMFDNYHQYLLPRMAVCKSAKELNKLTCV